MKLLEKEKEGLMEKIDDGIQPASSLSFLELLVLISLRYF